MSDRPVDQIGRLVADRGRTHGRFAARAAVEQALKEVLRTGAAWDRLNPAQRSAAEMIAVKLSRAVCGDPAEPDHWDDIAGYARLAVHPD